MKKLYRSAHDKKVFGLCGGLGEYLNVDSTLLRVAMIVTAIFSAGTVIPLYILASLVIPREPTYESPYYTPYHGGGAYSAGNGSYGNGPQTSSYTQHTSSQSQSKSDLDEMMRDIETKAMKKEIEELRAKLAKYEKGE